VNGLKVIAEIGGNHKGSMKIAKNMIDMLANFCGVDVVKFQKRNNKELLTEKEYNTPHPNPENSYAETYGEHRDALEFTKEQHAELKAYCEENGVIYSCSVWDLTSAKEIIELNPKYIKIPSAMNNNFELLNYVCDNFPGEIHISLGMTTKEEINKLHDFLLIDKSRLNDTIFYHCISDYPVKINNVCLQEIERIEKSYPGIKGVGFSGHHEGYNIDNLVICYGIQYIERHFTINKNWKGTDHIASLEPEEMRALVKNIKDSQAVWKHKNKEILDCEIEQRQKLKKIR
jgi:sialic acid synthase